MLSVSTHSRLKAAGVVAGDVADFDFVSTHSRLKAAGCVISDNSSHKERFNTQPPEGGWPESVMVYKSAICFNTQPPEGGWAGQSRRITAIRLFQHTAA